jgi:hypothetical protein
MELMPLAELLETEGLGSIGTSIFLNMMPTEAKQAVLLRPPLNGSVLDHELPGYFHSSFTTVIRAKGYLEGKELADQVFNALFFKERTLGTMYFRYCRPRVTPVSFPISGGAIIEWNIQFDVCFSEVS